MQVEIGYREGVVDDPVPARIGEPFYEKFEILTMAVEEMAAEKLRASPSGWPDGPRGPRGDAGARDDLGRKDRAPGARGAPARREGADEPDRAHRATSKNMAATYDLVVPELSPGAPPHPEAMEDRPATHHAADLVGPASSLLLATTGSRVRVGTTRPTGDAPAQIETCCRAQLVASACAMSEASASAPVPSIGMCVPSG